MRRMLPLILALLLLTACGAPAAEATPSASPVPSSPLDLITPGTASVPIETVSPERASSRAVPETMTLPDAGFEPESYWFAEPFGDGGQALLLMSGDGRFKCWYSSWHEHPEIDWINLTGGSFTEAEAEAAAEGEALTLEYAESWDSPRPERFSAASYEEALAAFLAASVAGGALTLEYAETADTPRPERFTAITRDEALRAHRDMPYNDELSLPVPERVGRGEWEATPGVTPVSYSEGGVSGAVYEYMGATVTFDAMSGAPLYFSGFTTESAAFPFKVRGVGIGSSGENVLASFPSNVLTLADAGEHHTFYGGYFGYMGTWDTDDDWRGGDVIMVKTAQCIR